MEGVAALAFLLLVCGYYLAGKQRLSGQYYLLLANIVWFGYSVTTSQSILALQSGVLSAINVYSMIHWRNNESN